LAATGKRLARRTPTMVLNRGGGLFIVCGERELMTHFVVYVH
jgi:hypothetical protein